MHLLNALFPPGAELLATELSAMDYIPGIEIPSETNKKVRLEGGEDRTVRDAEEQNAEFDAEADRLFGDASGSEEDSDEDLEVEEGSAGEEDSEGEEGSEQLGSGSPSPDSALEQMDSDQIVASGEGSDSDLQSAQLAASAAIDAHPANLYEPPSRAVLDHLE